jgi:hypothetical protein
MLRSLFSAFKVFRKSSYSFDHQVFLQNAFRDIERLDPSFSSSSFTSVVVPRVIHVSQVSHLKQAL